MLFMLEPIGILKGSRFQNIFYLKNIDKIWGSVCLVLGFNRVHRTLLPLFSLLLVSPSPSNIWGLKILLPQSTLCCSYY